MVIADSASQATPRLVVVATLRAKMFDTLLDTLGCVKKSAQRNLFPESKLREA